MRDLRSIQAAFCQNNVRWILSFQVAEVFVAAPQLTHGGVSPVLCWQGSYRGRDVTTSHRQDHHPGAELPPQDPAWRGYRCPRHRR